jgi:peptidoglycan/LPS O-acetylase OafA/YrhL
MGVSLERSATHRLSGLEKIIVGLDVFVGIGALAGGGLLSLAPDGHLLGMPSKLLAGTPFPDFLVPGLILFTAIGVLPLLAAVATVRRLPIAALLAVGVGVLLVGWIAVEMVILAGPGSLAWSLYLVLGTAVLVLGGVWLRSPHPNS